MTTRHLLLLVVVGCLTAVADAADKSSHMHKFLFLNFSAISPPDQSVDLTWALAPGTAHSYDFKQLVTFNFGAQDIYDIAGTLTLKSVEAETANVKVTLHVQQNSVDPNGKTTRGPRQKSPPAVGLMTKTGDFKNLDEGSETLLTALMSLPHERLAVGDTFSRPVKYPFIINTLSDFATGEMTFTFTGYVNHNGTPAAQFDSNILITEYTPPPNVKGNYKVYVHGKGRSFFDIDQRKFIEATNVFLVKVYGSGVAAAPTNAQQAELLRKDPQYGNVGFVVDSYASITSTAP